VSDFPNNFELFFSFNNSFHCDRSQWHSSPSFPFGVLASVSFYRPLASSFQPSSIRLGQFLSARVLPTWRWEKKATRALQIVQMISRRPLAARPATCTFQAKMFVEIVTQFYCFNWCGFVNTEWVLFWGHGLVVEPMETASLVSTYAGYNLKLFT